MGDGRAKDLAGLMCPPSSWFFFDAVRTAARRAVRPDKRRAGPNIVFSRPEQIVGFFRRPPVLQEGLGSSDGTASRWICRCRQGGGERKIREIARRAKMPRLTHRKEAGGRAGASFSVDPDRDWRPARPVSDQQTRSEDPEAEDRKADATEVLYLSGQRCPNDLYSLTQQLVPSPRRRVPRFASAFAPIISNERETANPD